MEWLPGNKKYDLADKYNIEVFRRRRPGQHRLRVRYLDPRYPEKVKSYHAIRKLPCRCAKRQGISYFMSVPG